MIRGELSHILHSTFIIKEKYHVKVVVREVFSHLLRNTAETLTIYSMGRSRRCDTVAVFFVRHLFLKEIQKQAHYKLQKLFHGYCYQR